KSPARNWIRRSLSERDKARTDDSNSGKLESVALMRIDLKLDQLSPFGTPPATVARLVRVDRPRFAARPLASPAALPTSSPSGTIPAPRSIRRGAACVPLPAPLLVPPAAAPGRA